MADQMILVCRLEGRGYFSKWINKRRIIGSASPYHSLYKRSDIDWAVEDVMDSLDFPILCGPLYKWRE